MSDETNTNLEQALTAEAPAPTAPSLTLDPVLESPESTAQAPTLAMPGEEKKVQEAALDDSMLSPEEKKQVDEFSKKIDLNNSALVMQYGAGTQQKMAGFSEKALDNVRTKDLGEVGDMLTGVVKELKNFNTDEEEKGLFGFFKKGTNKITDMKLRYDKAETNVNKIASSLEQHQVTLLKDIATLDQMYDLNKTYFKELSMYILAGKKKLEETRNTVIVELRAKAAQTGLPEDAQAVNDMEGVCNRFEKKLHDLELTRTISIQTAPQIRLVQNNDTLMAEKIQSTLVNTIPLWKSQMVLALGVAHSTEAAKAQNEVTNMTNELLRKNADTLKIATIETAKESERGIVDLETLQHTNESLISTLDEVMTIQEEGKQRRREAEVELSKLEGELKSKLLEIRK